MEIAILGLPQSGKTTIFNALTKGKAPVESGHAPSTSPHIGVAKVPDDRLCEIEKAFQPKKVTPAEIKYTDITAVPSDFGKGEGIAGKILTYLMDSDAIVRVVRCFPDENVPHLHGSVDPRRDLGIMDLELAFSDLAIISRRLERIEESLKGAKSPERELQLREKSLLQKIREGLEEETPIRRQGLTAEQTKSLSNYQFLTAKPMLILLNLGEGQLAAAKDLEDEVRSYFPDPQTEIMSACGKLEMEISQLSDSDANVFREALGIKESPLNRLVSFSYRLLGLISFFTFVSGEVRAWAVARGSTAVKAAGRIHTDMERGFIRAEVMSFDDFRRIGNLAEAKRQGVLRSEGKTYPVQDGDIITFLFNV